MRGAYLVGSLAALSVFLPLWLMMLNVTVAAVSPFGALLLLVSAPLIVFPSLYIFTFITERRRATLFRDDTDAQNQ